jgi:hypothetical protein
LIAPTLALTDGAPDLAGTVVRTGGFALAPAIVLDPGTGRAEGGPLTPFAGVGGADAKGAPDVFWDAARLGVSPLRAGSADASALLGSLAVSCIPLLVLVLVSSSEPA